MILKKRLLKLTANCRSNEMADVLVGSVAYFDTSCKNSTVIKAGNCIGKIINAHLDGLSPMYWQMNLYVDLDLIDICPFKALKRTIGFDSFKDDDREYFNFGLLTAEYQDVDEEFKFLCRDAEGFEFYLSESDFHCDKIKLSCNYFDVLEVEI